MIKLFLRKKKRFTAIEIEPGFVKLAQAEEFAGSRKIVKLVVKKLTSQAEEDISQTLKEILTELKGEVGNLSICLPRHRVSVRFLWLPTVEEREIAKMVELQSVKELPFSKEEIISDYLISEQTKDGYTKVIMVIVHQDIVERYLNLFKEARFQPYRITLSTEAVLHWYREALGEKEVCLLIDLDSENIDIVIFERLGLGFTRGLTFGISQLEKEIYLKEKLIEEVTRTIEVYSREEKTKTKKIEKILLASGGETAINLKSLLQRKFSLPCQIISPLKNLNCENKILSFPYDSRVSLLRVLGAVQEVKDKRLNLLPRSLRARQEIRLRRKKRYTIAFLFSGIILLFLLIFAKKIYDKQVRIFYLEREIKKTAPKAQRVENMLKKISLIKAWRKITGSSIDILREIHQLVSAGIYFSSFSYDETKREVVLQGISQSMPEIIKLPHTLEKSAYFKNVRLKYVSEKKAGGFTEFEIEGILEK